MTNTYLNYTEYQNLGGTLPQNLFKTLEYKAELKVDEYTFNRFRNESITTYPNELKMCIYDLIPILSNIIDSNISSESLGNHSVTYKNSEEYGNSINDIIKSYLSNIKIDGVLVLYRGF